MLAMPLSMPPSKKRFIVKQDLNSALIRIALSIFSRISMSSKHLLNAGVHILQTFFAVWVLAIPTMIVMSGYNFERRTMDMRTTSAPTSMISKLWPMILLAGWIQSKDVSHQGSRMKIHPRITWLMTIHYWTLACGRLVLVLM
jgi:hypothetical protein